MSWNKLYDEISSKVGNEINFDLEIFTYVKHLPKEYLDNIYSLILCVYVEECSLAGYTIEDILVSLNSVIPYDGRILNISSGKGVSFNVSKLSPKVLTVITYYLKNYFVYN
jgi:hypothetical protein